MWFLKLLFIILISYGLGSICFAYIITKWRLGQDIRTLGSGNAGFTNTMRVLPKVWAFTVFGGDVLKGCAAAWIGQALLGPWGAIAASLAVLAGHMWPFWLQFKGGKGVATAFGIGLILVPAPALIGIMLFLIVLLATRYVSLSSLVGVCSAFVTSLLMHYPWQYVVICLVLAVATVYMHRANIGRLRNGTEPKIGEKKD